MGERAAAQLLADVPVATAVRIEVRKPAAVPAAQCSFVRVERTR
jgi:dihydroneopterin aldolase